VDVDEDGKEDEMEGKFAQDDIQVDRRGRKSDNMVCSLSPVLLMDGWLVGCFLFFDNHHPIPNTALRPSGVH